MKTKKCSKCKAELLLVDFGNRTNRKGEIVKRSQCKKCEALCESRSHQKRHEYYEKNKERLIQRSRTWYKNNREKSSLRSKKWRENNGEYIKQYTAEYRKSHREELRKKAREFFQKNKKRIIEANRPYAAKYYRENKDKILQYTRQWYLANKKHVADLQRQRTSTAEFKSRRRKYGREYYAKNTERMLELFKKSRIKKMVSIYGPDWQSRNFHGECLTADILASLFPNIKILRGAAGKIATSGTCIRKHVYPDFRFNYLDKDIIIEYNGEQHYRHIPAMMPLKKFLEVQERDRWLRDYCQKNNKILIEIDERKVHTDKSKIEIELRTKLTKCGIL